jgi:uncharacterized delta-60 repeat protein
LSSNVMIRERERERERERGNVRYYEQCFKCFKCLKCFSFLLLEFYMFLKIVENRRKENAFSLLELSVAVGVAAIVAAAGIIATTGFLNDAGQKTSDYVANADESIRNAENGLNTTLNAVGIAPVFDLVSTPDLLSYNSVQLSWSAPTNVASPVTEYIVFVDGEQIAVLPPNQTTYIVENLEPGVTYEVTIRTVNENGTADETMNVAVPLPPLPDAPWFISSASVSPTSSTVTWEKPTGSIIDGYRVTLNGQLVDTLDADATSYDFYGLTEDFNHIVTVSAFNAAGATVGDPVAFYTPLTGGKRDTSFTTNTGASANSTVHSVAVQTDGKILVGGQFSTWNGTTVNRLVRLNSDGTIDTAFTTNAGTAANSTVLSVAVQTDGKILVGGSFTTWNGTTANYMVRLNSDGTRDTAFTTNTGTAANNTVRSIAIQTDGKILVGGSFTTWNGTTANYVVRLNSTGTRDTAFTTNTGTAAISIVWSIAVQTDGKILVGGQFRTWNGTTVNRIVRLNSDGTIDTAFTTNTGTAANNTVRSIAIQTDGKILLGGTITTWNDTTVNGIVRLNADGTRDTAFTTNTGTAADSIVHSVAVQTDGKILVGGQFSTWNGTTVNFIVRLNADGTRDTAFTTNTGTASINTVFSVAVQTDGKILVGGDFTTWNGTTVNRLVRLGGF